MKEIITNITLYYIPLPIKQSYHLSFGDINYFETVIVEIEIGDIRVYGESTPLFGYSHETISSVLEHHRKWAKQLIKKDIKAGVKILNEEIGKVPFAANAFYTALEIFRAKRESSLPYGHVKPKHSEIPMVGIISSNNFNEIQREILKQKDDGFSIIKVKVGSSLQSVSQDIEKIHYIHNLIPDMPLRVDANKAYNFSQAIDFIKNVQDCNIEVFEQPLLVELWNEQKKVFKIKEKVPLMLDESINTIQDLEYAISNECCNYVKFKLMKHGSFEITRQMIERALSANLQVIIGNGVQSEWACMQEAQLIAQMDKVNAGENNGFLKQKFSILDEPIHFQDGNMRVTDVTLSIKALRKNSDKIYQYN